MPDIRTESEEFNRRFEVRSSDRRFALAFVDARMMRWLLDQPPGNRFAKHAKSDEACFH